MGHSEWGIGHGNNYNAQCPMPNAQCPMPNPQCPNAQSPIPNTSLREAAPTTYLGSGSIERSRDARHESLSTSAQCPIPNAQSPIPNAQCPIPNSQFPILLYERLRQRLTSAPAPSSEVEMLGTSRSVQVPNPQSPIPNPQFPIPNPYECYS
jgi:hypothetical protein